MNKSLYLLFFSVCFIVCSACSKDDDKNPIVGNWKLKSWSIEIPINLKTDTSFSTNLLDETNCEVNEILSFDKNGLVTSHNTFNPELKVRLKDGTTDIYLISETCAEGTIGFAAEYKQITDQSVGFNGVVAVVTGATLTVVYEDAFKVYNEAFTEVVDTKDLTLVYEK